MLRDVASEAPVDAILSYARYNLMVTDLDELLRPFCEENGVGLINASPLHLRILTDRGAPAWHPAAEEVKQTGVRLAALCRECGTNISDVAMRFCFDYRPAASTLVGMSKQHHVERNLAVLETENDPVLVEKIVTVVAPVKNKIWPTGRAENWD